MEREFVKLFLVPNEFCNEFLNETSSKEIYIYIFIEISNGILSFKSETEKIHYSFTIRGTRGKFRNKTRRFFEMRGKKKRKGKKKGKRSQVKQRKKKGEEERMESVLRIPGACLSKLKGGKHALLCLVEQKQHSTVRV